MMQQADGSFWCFQKVRKRGLKCRGGRGGGEGNQLAVINQKLNAQLLQSVSTGLKVALFGTVPVVL